MAGRHTYLFISVPHFSSRLVQASKHRFFTLAMSVYVIGDKEKEYKKGYNQALKDIVNVVAEEIKNDKVSNTEEGSNE